MSEKWFFTRDGDVVVLRGRFEADDGTIGDAFKVVRPGERVIRLLLSEAVQREGGHARDREGRERAHRVAAAVRSGTFAQRENVAQEGFDAPVHRVSPPYRMSA